MQVLGRFIAARAGCSMGVRVGVPRMGSLQLFSRSDDVARAYDVAPVCRVAAVIALP